MSGHSKWATIRRKKEKTDAARGRTFTKLIKEISVAARMGGGDVETNPRLRVAVAAAKSANMPADNITRAIKKGTGELPGTVYDEVTYEGYGPGGCAILIDALTDNKNRTLAEVRHLFSKYGGNLADNNAVAYLFERKAVIELEPGDKTEDEIMELALEAGAEDVVGDEEGAFTITGEPNDLDDIRQALEDAGNTIRSAEVSMVPQTTVEVEEKYVGTLLKLMDLFDENDDVQKVYSNFDIDPSLISDDE
ncbi:YebC/PmpR family DNA-binding transcriptional regulator [bacterium]|nr:YebC/PmpR family DNA-binding transcriptional regulator [bacterium]